ncbi:hypothetical protein QBC35DRAFT_496970 [Podospora australis]|uniref:FAD-binding FR-type domain-containing protein n=1 Tax=Podospora australis TaxID=1536484 RepID=A0AAN6WY21_9PEZI|nr:hypothetical protein QBC35DRAFT_496970 [Podospora australis]
MATAKGTHIERTANEPRDSSLHDLIIKSINQISPVIRIIQLSIPPPTTSSRSIQYLPGQWLDLYHPPFTPNQKPGGFTITSSPSPSSPQNTTIELAIQSSPSNPPAAYLWQDPPTSLLNTPVKVRIGGSFVFPPPSPSFPVKKVVFVAGGVGINPLMSMLSFISQDPALANHLDVRVLYGFKDPGLPEHLSHVLFLGRIVGLFASSKLKGKVELFITQSKSTDNNNLTELKVGGASVPVNRRRIELGDVKEVLGEDIQDSVVYICGVPAMTDELAEGLISLPPKGLGIDSKRVLYEKWW